MKTNKSISKRFKVTKAGKIIGRKPGFNHFNSKQPRGKQLDGKKGVELNMSNKSRKRFLSNI